MVSKSHIRSVLATLIVCSYICSINAQAQVPLKGLDTSVCNPGSITNSLTPKKPTLAETYRLTVECNIQNKNYSTDYTEYFDYQNQRAAVHQWDEGFHAYGIYNYASNEMYTVEAQTGVCTVDPLSSSSNTFLFGFKTSAKNPKVGRMFSAYGALRFGNGTKEQYMGQTKIRGMQVDQWKSCQYWSSMDATMTVNWYFTRPDWGMADGRKQVPVRCTVTGNIWEVKGSVRAARKFTHTYEFSEYLTDDMAHLTTKTFETPSGVICPGRKDTKPLPTPATAFKFTSEILTPDSLTIGFIKEWYDQKMGLVRYDYVPDSQSISPFGYGLLTQVHDFNEGIAYVIDPSVGNCTAQSIDGTGFDAKFVVGSNNMKVRIRTPAEFFYFDKTSYAYEGVKSVRGVDCDVYITQRTDWPPNTSGYKSTWEWYFAKKTWVQSTGHTYDFGMPMMLLLKSDGIGTYIYNIYQYDEEQRSIWEFDTSKCYNYTEKHDFIFRLPGSYQNVAAPNLQLFKYSVLLAIKGVSKVSAVRIANMQVDYDANDIIVSVSILGTALITGNVQTPVAQVPLSQAVTGLTNAINLGKFVVTVAVGSKTMTLTARPFSLTPTTIKFGYYKPGPNKTVYSTGAVVGLAVGMAVFAFILGFGAIYMFYKRNGGSFVKSDKPMDNPAYENAS
ncbi:uncharacterized protein [Mytilus edulis]|uniref:uncharacterized protein n=1 Tax=Mytilus edulis TaxID=6550 RepID=UPI0039F12A29